MEGPMEGQGIIFKKRLLEKFKKHLNYGLLKFLKKETEGYAKMNESRWLEK